jgi:hypothetical protein
MAGGRRELVVPADDFDPQGQRLKVRVIRHSESPGSGSPDCPSMEVETVSFVVECPTIEGEAKSRVDVLAVFVEPRTEESAAQR